VSKLLSALVPRAAQVRKYHLGNNFLPQDAPGTVAWSSCSKRLLVTITLVTITLETIFCLTQDVPWAKATNVPEAKHLRAGFWDVKGIRTL
jgi:hypothetical protein